MQLFVAFPIRSTA